MTISPLNKRRLENFKSNKRGLYSFWIFSFLFIISILADFIANEKPLLIKYNSSFYFPVIYSYSETTFGGDFETEADYRDPYVQDLINNNGLMIKIIDPTPIPNSPLNNLPPSHKDKKPSQDNSPI